MAEQPSVTDRLHELAERLRRSPRLSPEEQAELADLMDELREAVDPAKLPEPSQKHLTQMATHLVQTLHQETDAGVLAAASKRLEDAALRFEAEAPNVSGVLRRIIDALANLGI
jgi:hypothetical protein